MGYSRQEMETSVLWDDEQKTAKVYTASTITMRKLDKLAAQFPDVYRRTWMEETGGKVTAAKYEVDARYVRFGKPASEAQIARGNMLARAKINSAPRTAL